MIRVPLPGDRVNEPDETFLVRLSSPRAAVLGKAEATVTLRDDDPVELSIGDLSVVEGDAGTAEGRFPVTLSVPSVFEVSVSWSTSDLDALAGVDYQASSDTLTFAPGATRTEAVVPVLGDTLREPVESFLVTLAAPTSAGGSASLADPEAVGSIIDDDGILVSVTDVTVREGAGGEAVFQVSLNKPTTVDVTVAYATADGTATAGADYEATSGSVTIPAGASVVDILVPLVDDGMFEPTETFSVELANPSGDAILLDAVGEATVLDDDGWFLNGAADDAAIPGCIVLTPDATFQRGSAWQKSQLDLSRSFDKTMHVYLGERDSGADGIYFALQSQGPTALGGSGGSEGYVSIRSSIGFELDTNTDGRFFEGADHLSVGIDGSEHAGHQPVELPLFNIEDGQEHDLRIAWNAVTETFDVHFDGSETLVYPKGVMTNVFGGATEVFWGMTGGTGGRSNLQYFCDSAQCVDGVGTQVSVGDTRVVEGDTGTSRAHFPLTLSCPVDQPVTVSYRTVDGSALAGEDYLPASGSVTFSPGETSKDVVVEVVGETAAETDEAFFLDLSAPVGGGIRYGRGVGTILTDDHTVEVPEVRRAEGDVAGSTVAVPVVLGAPASETIRVDYTTADGTATAGSDYGAVAGSVSFAPGETEKEITIPWLGDLLDEGDEQFNLELSTASERARILDPRPAVTILDDDGCSGGNLLVNGSADEPLLDGEIPGWIEVTGSSWSQRTQSPAPLDGPAYFFPGAVKQAELRQDVDVSGLAASIDQGAQQFGFSGAVRSYNQGNPDTAQVVLEYRAADDSLLGSYDSGVQAVRTSWRAVSDIRTPPVGTRTIRVRLLAERHAGSNNDGYFDALVLRALGLPSFSVDDVELPEGEVGTSDLLFTIGLSCPARSATSVDYLTVDGTATAGSDYEATAGKVTLGPGQLAVQVPVAVLGDTLFEGAETFGLRLFNPSNAGLGDGVGVATILPDEVFASAADTSVVEGSTGTVDAAFTVALTDESPLPVTLSYATRDGSALAGEDYVATAGTLTFAPGETERTLTVPVLGDDRAEGDEAFSLVLFDPINASLQVAEADCIVVDDDVAISIADAAVVEGSAGTAEARFPVTLAAASSDTVTVDFATQEVLATEGVDYLPVSGTLTFEPGQVEAFVFVEILGDQEVEPSETFEVVLSNPVGGGILDGEATGFILDDDDCPSPNLIENPGAEEPAVDSSTPGWTDVAGGQWRETTGSPGALGGRAFFSPGKADEAELVQDVDLSAFSEPIDEGIQRFVFEGFYHGHSRDAEPDLGRVVVEYRDAANQTVLDRFDSGELPAPVGSWQPVVELQTVPPGTRWARVRLLASRRTGSTTDVYFDRLSLTSLGLPVLLVEDQVVAETNLRGAEVPIHLTCPSEVPVEARLVTRDETAIGDVDFVSTSGTIELAAGETDATFDVPLIRDEIDEPVERFLAVLETADVPSVRPQGEVTILDGNAPPTLEVSGGSFIEGDGSATTARFLVSLSSPSNFPVELGYQTRSDSALAGEDFVDSSGAVRLEPGSFQQVIEVPLIGDSVGEEHERFFLDVTRTSGVSEVVGAPSEALILDDDRASSDCSGSRVVSGRGARFLEGDRDSSVHSLLVTLDCPSDQEITAEYSTSALSALPGLDYVETSGSLTIAPGEVAVLIPLRIIGDVVPETDERFEVALESSEPGVATGGAVTVEITDDDPAGAAVEVSPEELDLLLPEGVRATKQVAVTVPPGSAVPAVDVYLLADTTTSMGSTINAVRAGASQLVDELSDSLPGVDLHFGVGDYRDLPGSDPPFRNRQALTGDRDAVITAIEGLTLAGGGSDLPEDQLYALDHLATDLDPSSGGSLGFRPEAEKIVVWFGDAPGHDPICSRLTGLDHEITESLVAAELRAAEIKVIALSVRSDGLDAYRSTSSILVSLCGSQAMPGQATRISQVTGGAYLSGINDGALLGVITDLTQGAVGRVDSATLSLTGETVDFLEGIDPASYGPFNTDEGDSFAFDTQFRGVVPCEDQRIQSFVGALDVLFDGGVVAQRPVSVTVPSCEGASVATVTVLNAEATEGDPGGGLEFVVQVSPSVDREVRVDFATEDGTALSDIDYLPQQGTLVFAPGETEQRVEVDLVNDSTTEDAEDVFLVLSDAVGAEISGARGRGTILDDDQVAGVAELIATKTDSLALDADADGVPSPGDEIAYTIEITNTGGAPATEVTLTDLVPEHAVVVPESVETSVGSVASERPVEVSLGELPAGASATVTFRVAVDLPLPAGVDRITNQGTVTSAELPAVLTDDPDLGGDADPTVTMLTAAPELVAEKTDRLALDADGDGAVSPGDEVEYTVTVRNVGNTAATGVGLADPAPDHAAIVAGSVSTSQGTVDQEAPSVVVTLGEIAGAADATVRFRVTVENPIPAGVRELSNQGLVASAELPDVVTDDPEVDGAADPTVTPVVAAPELLVEKGDSLFEDVGGDGLASPGDVLLYRMTVRNVGNTPATGVVLTDAIPDHTVLEPGTLQSSAGTVMGDDPAAVDVGQLDVGDEVVVTFRVRIDEPFPLEVLEISNQAEVASAELESVLSDDPGAPGDTDPTVTPVFIVPEVTVDDVTVSEAGGPATFSLTLSEASNRPVRAPFSTADGPGGIGGSGTSPATAGLDYLAASGTVVFAPGETARTVPVEILDDALDELDETFTLSLGEVEGGVVADGSGLGTIVDDDPPPFVSIGDATVIEGDPPGAGSTGGSSGGPAAELVFPVTLSGPSGLGIAIDYATAPVTAGRAAEAGVDYGPVSGTLSFPPGVTTASIRVPVTPELLDELDETVRVVLSNPLAVVPADAEALGTIIDDDEARVSVDDLAVEEGDEGTADALVPVRLSLAADREIRVDFATVAGTATAGSDYLPVSGTLTFTAGATESRIAVPVVGDRFLEPLEETLTIELSGATDVGGTTAIGIEDGEGTLTILDDERCPGPNLLANPGAELHPVDGALPAWSEVAGTDWQRRFADPEPAEGAAYFAAGAVDFGELAQDVSVEAYQVRIEARIDGAPGQRFAFTGKVRTLHESPPDTARIVVEYRDRTNAVVLDAFDSGEIVSPDGWRRCRMSAPPRRTPAGSGCA